MNMLNLLKNKWILIIGGVIVFINIILISLERKKIEEVKPTEISQKQQEVPNI